MDLYRGIRSRGNRVWTGRDGRGNLAEVRRYDGTGKELNRAQYRYNGMGELTAAVDGRGNELLAGYDLAGRRTETESGDTGRKTWGYDAAGWTCPR
jgi:YD repeat-containing protein